MVRMATAIRINGKITHTHTHTKHYYIVCSQQIGSKKMLICVRGKDSVDDRFIEHEKKKKINA